MVIFHSYGDVYQRVNQRHHFNDLGVGKKPPRIHPRVRHFCWSCLGLKLLKLAMGQNPGTQSTQQKRAGLKGCWFHQIWSFHVISTRSPMKIPYIFLHVGEPHAIPIRPSPATPPSASRPMSWHRKTPRAEVAGPQKKTGIKKNGKLTNNNRGFTLW